jgi:hypothetical protein
VSSEPTFLIPGIGCASCGRLITRGWYDELLGLYLCDVCKEAKHR